MGRRLIQGQVDRTGRHPIRSTILAAIAAALATIALVLAASGNPAVAASSLVNGNFETGDLTGWSVDTTGSGETASAVKSYSAPNPFGCEFDDCHTPPETYFYDANPHEGSYFALLKVADQSQWTTISQPFTASNGDRISGWVFTLETLYQKWGHTTPGFEDKGQVVLTDGSGTTVATLFKDSGSSGEVGYCGTTECYNNPWKYWEYTFTDLPGEGQFQIQAKQSSQMWGPYGPNVLGLDDVKISRLAPDATKPSTSATRSVEPNAAGWNKQNVTVKLNATDNQGGSGVQKITYSASGAQSISQTDAPGDSVEVALDREGTTTLTYYATDKAGNVEDKKTLTVKIDKSAPTGTVTINDGASSTRSRSVTLTLSATDLSPGSGVSRMRISNTQSGLSSATWEAYSTTKSWTLSSGQGTKTVYVQYRDGAGNRSGVVTDTIRFAR